MARKKKRNTVTIYTSNYTTREERQKFDKDTCREIASYRYYHKQNDMRLIKAFVILAIIAIVWIVFTYTVIGPYLRGLGY